MFAALIVSKGETETDGEISQSFSLSVLGAIAVLCSFVFYFADAVVALLEVHRKVRPVFNGILASVIISSLYLLSPYCFLPTFAYAFWLTAIFILEVFSIVYRIKDHRN